MKYLVNRETKEHQIASEIAASSMERYPSFAQDWKVVEADSKGWIPWSGGECPLPIGSECNWKTVSEFNGSCAYRPYTQEAQCLRWSENDIIAAYRPILAETAEKEEKQQYTEPTKVEYLFDRLKSAVEAANTIPVIIARINLLLPDGYCVTRCAEQPAEDMSDWRSWKEGDILECVRPTDFHTKGRLYLIGTDSEGDYGILDDQGDVLDHYAPGGECFTRSYFRFHSRPGKESV